MHELGVVFHIADSLAKIAEENHVARISRVTLQLGEVSTVVPEYPSRVCNLHHSSRQHRIVNPLSKGRDRIRNLMVPSRIR